MARAGRKRKVGKRYPNGRLIPVWEDPAALARQNRARDVWRTFLKKHILNPEIGYPLGAFHALGIITDEQFNAGVAWAAVTARWRQVMGEMPMPHCKAIKWDGEHGKVLSSEPSEEEIAAVKGAKRAQDDAIRSSHIRGMSIMEATILEDREPDGVAVLIRALNALVELRGQRRKAA